jgi:tRNA1(Val) A37 N6-methylase TrmN6
MLAAFAGRFGAIELVPIHPRPSRPAIRLIVRARKGRRTALSMLHGLVLADEAGRPTQAAEAVLRHAEPLGAA